MKIPTVKASKVLSILVLISSLVFVVTCAEKPEPIEPKREAEVESDASKRRASHRAAEGGGPRQRSAQRDANEAGEGAAEEDADREGDFGEGGEHTGGGE